MLSWDFDRPRGNSVAVCAFGCAAALILGLLAACASDEPSERSGGREAGRGDEHRPPHGSLFISPSGQPFRAEPGEPYPVARWFAQADRNGDGHIDRSEFRADAEAFFKQLDKNHDGVIDGFEITDYEQAVVPEILGAYRAPGGPADAAGGDEGERRHGHGRGGAGGGQRSDDSAGGAEVMGGAAPYELLADPEPVAAADQTLSGHVSLADFLAAADRRFDRLDAKGLGYLILADLPKTPVQRAAMAKKPRHGQDDR
jgi:hypothetical protein